MYIVLAWIIWIRTLYLNLLSGFYAYYSSYNNGKLKETKQIINFKKCFVWKKLKKMRKLSFLKHWIMKMNKFKTIYKHRVFYIFCRYVLENLFLGVSMHLGLKRFEAYLRDYKLNFKWPSKQRYNALIALSDWVCRRYVNSSKNFIFSIEAWLSKGRKHIGILLNLEKRQLIIQRFQTVLGIHSIFMRIRILDPHWKKMDPDPNPDPDPGHFFKIYWIF